MLFLWLPVILYGINGTIYIYQAFVYYFCTDLIYLRVQVETTWLPLWAHFGLHLIYRKVAILQTRFIKTHIINFNKASKWNF